MAPKSAPKAVMKAKGKQKETADTDHPMGDNEQPVQPVEVSKGPFGWNKLVYLPSFFGPVYLQRDTGVEGSETGRQQRDIEGISGVCLCMVDQCTTRIQMAGIFVHTLVAGAIAFAEPLYAKVPYHTSILTGEAQWEVPRLYSGKLTRADFFTFF
jgi:hypothetical protein